MREENDGLKLIVRLTALVRVLFCCHEPVSKNSSGRREVVWLSDPHHRPPLKEARAVAPAGVEAGSMKEHRLLAGPRGLLSLLSYTSRE